MTRWLSVVAVVLVAWGAVIFNGAGFSQADDLYALDTNKRSLLRATYDMNYALEKRGHSGMWMETNVFIHAVASLAVMGLAGPWPAVLFAAHPIAGDAVASVAGRSSLLCGALVLLTLLAFKHRMYYATSGLAILAFMAKEEAVALVILLPAAAWIWERRRQAILLLGLAAALAITSLASSDIVQSTRGAGVEQTLVDAGLAAPLPYPERVAATFSAIGTHAMTALFSPLWLCVDPRAEFNETGAVFVLLVAVLLMWAWIAGYPHKLAIVLLAAPLVVYLPAGLNDAFFEHRAYLAAAGAAWMLSTIPRARWIVLAFFLVMANYRGYVYGSPRRLWAEAVARRPDNVRARINLGMVMWSENDKQGAETQFLAARPAKAAYQNLAGLYMSEHDLARASDILDILEGR